MPKFDFTVRCSKPGCGRVAAYKIAAEWKGVGVTELKTFGFADAECLVPVLAAAAERAAKTQCDEGEALGPMRIYNLDTRRHDYELERAYEMEEKLLGKRSD